MAHTYARGAVVDAALPPYIVEHLPALRDAVATFVELNAECADAYDREQGATTALRDHEAATRRAAVLGEDEPDPTVTGRLAFAHETATAATRRAAAAAYRAAQAVEKVIQANLAEYRRLAADEAVRSDAHAKSLHAELVEVLATRDEAGNIATAGYRALSVAPTGVTIDAHRARPSGFVHHSQIPGLQRRESQARKDMAAIVTTFPTAEDFAASATALSQEHRP